MSCAAIHPIRFCLRYTLPLPAVLLLLAVVSVAEKIATACPFCDVASQTLSEELQAADTAVFAKLIKEAVTESPADGTGSTNASAGNATFEIIEVLRGQDKLAEAREIEVVFFGNSNREQLFLVTGIGGEQIDWATPLPLSEAAVKYIRELPKIAPSGPDRLAFFQEYFEHEDPLLAQDTYDEFARAPYAELKALGTRMHHDRLAGWIQDPEVSPSRRRLYLTMLGVCGNKDDIPLLEAMIVSDYDSKKPFVENLVSSGMSLGGPVALPTWIEFIKQDERRKKLGLDSLIACYLVLRGPEGLDLIDERLLKHPQVEYTYIYSTIMALRFHGEESSVVPRERLLNSMRLLLDNPDFADQVIPDLSRWEDWSVLDRLVEMFKASDDKGFIRQPVITYLTVASEQEGEVGERANAALVDLEKFDPESVQRARSLMAFGLLGRGRAGGDAASTTGEGAARLVDVASDPAEGFAASAVDVESADQADMPDPNDYGSGGAGDLPPTDTEVTSTTDVDVVADPTAEVSNQAVGSDREAGDNQTVENESTEPAATTDHRVAEPTSSVGSVSGESGAQPSVDLPPSPWLIIGVPLLVGAALTVLYWWILRSGAL